MAGSLLTELKLTNTKQSQTIEKPPNMYMNTEDIHKSIYIKFKTRQNYSRMLDVRASDAHGGHDGNGPKTAS